MELILKEDIIGLGYKNDIVNVKSGYGRNYLIPQQKAVIASPSAKKILAENLKQQAHKIAAQKAAAEDKAKAFEGVALEIMAKVAVTGQLYGSVGAAQVVEALAAKGIEVDRKIVTMKEAKKVGEYEATVHFHKEVEVKVPVTVVAENAPVAAPVEEKKEEAPVVEAPVVEAPVVEEAPVAEAPAEEEAPAEA
jgi:large subunit ribosomal protein L9